ncbi:uncharacterized protein LOC144446705 [Glandiceps talaboti]
MKFIQILAIILVELLYFYSPTSGYVLPLSEKNVSTENNKSEKITERKFPLTEEEAWEFFGVQRCQDGQGMECFFHGSDHSQCFAETDFICDGITDCQCENDSDFCITDETLSVCAWKDIIEAIKTNGIPSLGFGKKDHEAFLVLWMSGLKQFCPADKDGINKLRCHSDPTVCISPEELCDGTYQCEQLCDTLHGTNEKCMGDEDFTSCRLRDTFSILLGSVFLADIDHGNKNDTFIDAKSELPTNSTRATDYATKLTTLSTILPSAKPTHRGKPTKPTAAVVPAHV